MLSIIALIIGLLTLVLLAFNQRRLNRMRREIDARTRRLHKDK